MNDDKFYNQVAEEIQAKKMLPGLWTRAFAEAGGNTERARALYIKLRVAQLTKTAKQESVRIRQIQSETKRKQMLAKIRQIIFSLFTVVCGFLAFSCIIGVGVTIFAPDPGQSFADRIGMRFFAGFIGVGFIGATLFCLKRAQRK